MKLIVTMLILALLAPTVQVKQMPCKTTFIITDCRNEPVPGAVVTIETCFSKETKSRSTNVSGEVSFPVCKKDICATRVSTIGYKPGLVNDCSGTASNTVCKVKICK